jgi:hypothetical protein
MTIKSLGNSIATFRDRFGKTGTRASGELLKLTATSSGTIATPASGLAPGNGYVYHTFTGPGTFTASGLPGTVEVFVVAGGGGGGNYNGGGNGGGGGGAGGLVYHPAIPISIGSYPVTVGSGGSKNPSPNGVLVGGNGTDSIFNGLTSKGGGGGGGYTSDGTPGGSGGGTGGASTTTATGTQPSQTHPTSPSGWTNYGNPGGPNVGNPGRGSGGGGAGAAGGAGGAGNVGGVGVQFPAFTGPLIGVPALAPLSGYFAGGGGGGGYPSGQPNTGGLGGGGGPTYGTAPIPGVTNSGGGGAAGTDNSVVAGDGGPGIVIIRYLA